MFKKLLSNLPFNPSLIGEVAFYAKRLHRESALRRTGFVLLALAIAIQIFAVASPPEPTLAESNNDIVRGGFSSREQAVTYCRSNTQDFANILAYYKVSCEALASGATKTIRSTDNGKALDSMGRVPQGSVIARTGKPTDEYSVMINGTEYFMRNLWSWDSGSSSTYKVLEVKNSDGTSIMILYNCGNIVTVGKYTPPEKPRPQTPEPKDLCSKIPGTQTNKAQCDVCPNVPGEQTNKDECYPCPEAKNNDATTACLELTKTASNPTQKISDANGTMAFANDTVLYTLKVTNKGTQAVKGFVIEENMSDVLEYAEITDMHGGQKDDKQIVRWPKQDIAAGTSIQKQISVKIKDPVPQTPISASDPASFDLVMTNVYYGTSVSIKLPSGTVKSTEAVVQSLPSTGPGTTLAVAFGVITVAGYFFARSRLLAKELSIITTDFSSTGGL